MEVGEIVRELKARARDATRGEWFAHSAQKGAGEDQWITNLNPDDPEYDDLPDEEYDALEEIVIAEKLELGYYCYQAATLGWEEFRKRYSDDFLSSTTPQDRKNFAYIAAASPQRIELVVDELERLQKIEQQVLDERRERFGMTERLPLMAEDYAYYLLGLDKDGAIVQEDGGHRGPDGVTTAMKLFHRLGFVREGVTYIMVKSSPVPDMEVQINEEAAATCRWMLDEYGGKAQDGSSATLEDVALVEEMDWTYRVYRAKKLAKGKAYFSEFVTGYETSGGQRRAKEDAIDHARAISSEVWFSPEKSGQWRLLEAQDG